MSNVNTEFCVPKCASVLFTYQIYSCICTYMFACQIYFCTYSLAEHVAVIWIEFITHNKLLSQKVLHFGTDHTPYLQGEH